MLTIVIPEREAFDNATQQFVSIKETKIELEHSLISISKWESKWKKPFLGQKLSPDEFVDYIRCMFASKNFSEGLLMTLLNSKMREIRSYIDDTMTATWFRETNRPINKRILTSEVIYAYMILLNIPQAYERWHINRLMTLIRVVDEEQAPKKKQSKKDMLAERRALNNQRRARLGTKG